ncbi:DUF4282 domain-containing protein [Corynebacterium sp. YSMAA1_1_F7]|uniref:DUF4282 domain-containing protein n=1 Tax=Corynebacterium sp. YSMAA1_1_F7 TaxID=3383590 RepID=UPI0038D11FFF
MTTPSNPYGSEEPGKHAADGADNAADNVANNGADYGANYGTGNDAGYGADYGTAQNQTPDQTQDYSQGFGQYDSSQFSQQDPYGQTDQTAQYDQFGQADQYNQTAQPQGAPGFAAYPNQQMANTTGVDKDGFFSALFDFSFTRYATPSVVKVLYVLLMIVVVLFLLLILIAGLAALTEDGSAILVLLIGLPLAGLGGIAWLAFYRVGLEVAISVIRTAQSVQSIDERQARNSTNGS